MNQNSLNAFAQINIDGTVSRQELKVLSVIKKAHTSREISSLSGIERSSVCARLNALVERGLVIEKGNIVCDITNKEVTRYKRAKIKWLKKLIKEST